MDYENPDADRQVRVPRDLFSSYGVALHRPGRFCVSPRSLIQKFAVPAVPGPVLSSSQSKRRFSLARLYDRVFPDVSVSANTPSKSFCADALCDTSIPFVVNRPIPSSFRKMSLWWTVVPGFSSNNRIASLENVGNA